MKISEITYSKGQTLQLRQFEPVNVHFSAKAELDEFEANNAPLTHEAYQKLKEIVDQEIAIQTEMLQGNSGKIVRAAAKELLKKEESPF